MLREAEKAADDALLAEIADGKDLRRLVAQLERKLEQNMEMRAKYPDEPAKFMESEISLDQARGLGARSVRRPARNFTPSAYLSA